MPVLCLSRFLPGVAGPFKISVVSISELFGNLIIAPMKRRSERETERQRDRETESEREREREQLV